MAPDPQVTEALQAVLAQRGWTLTAAQDGLYAAEQVGVTLDPMIASATPDGLVRALNAREQHIAGTKAGHLHGAPRTVITQ